jgi:PLP dependent protein
MSIASNILEVRNGLPSQVSLVAVSKTRSVDLIMEAYQAGQRIFGENRVHELLTKQSVLPGDIHWHLIGHLQTNKVKAVVPFVHLIQSVDSLKLLIEIDREAGKCGRVIDCLLQFHIASEETKYGLDRAEGIQLLNDPVFSGIRHARIVGVMGMATYTQNEDVVRSEFRELNSIHRQLKSSFFADTPSFNVISMGMTGDYKIAIEEGSTMVRLGTLIFGERNHTI